MQTFPFNIVKTGKSALQASKATVQANKAALQDGKMLRQGAAQSRAAFASFMSKHLPGIQDFAAAAHPKHSAQQAVLVWQQGNSSIKKLQNALGNTLSSSEKKTRADLEQAWALQKKGAASSRFASSQESFATQKQAGDFVDTKKLSKRLAALADREKKPEDIMQTLASLQDVRISMEDFASLKEQLGAFGLSKEKIQALSEKISSKEGLTWGQFMAGLSAYTQTQGTTGMVQMEFDQEETARLQGLFAKMHYTPQEASALVSQLSHGRPQEVLNTLQKKLTTLPATTSLNLTAAELGTLGRALNLSEENLGKLASLLQGAKKITLTPETLKKSLDQLTIQTQKEVKAGQDAEKNLWTSVLETMDKSTQRQARKALADNRTDNTEHNLKALAEQSKKERAQQEAKQEAAYTAADRGAKTGQEKGTADTILSADPRLTKKNASQTLADKNTIKNEAEQGQEEQAGKQPPAPSTASPTRKTTTVTVVKHTAAASGEPSGTTSTVNASPSDTVIRQTVASQTTTHKTVVKEVVAKQEGPASFLQQNTDKAESETKTATKTADTPKDFSGDTEGSNSQDTDEMAWKDLWENRIRRESTASSSRAQAIFKETGISGMPVENTAEAPTNSITERLGKTVTARVLQQVQSGVLKTVAPGRTQLVLEIDPPQLGRLHMALQLKDGEVSAMFRTETQDTSRLLAENLNQLRVALENQGLKVSKMEVQTQLQDNQQNQNWQGNSQHNDARQQRDFEARQRVWQQLRQEARQLAQQMQDSHEISVNPANTADNGLYVIA